jgi:protein ImuB
MFACIHIPDLKTPATAVLLECAGTFSPSAEITAPNTVVFSIKGLNLLYSGAQEVAQAIAGRMRDARLSANIAVARNADAAILAARNFTGVTVIPDQTSKTLAGLHVKNLPLSPQTYETLQCWGIRTFADLSRLPETGIAERLGPDAVKLQKLARGAIERPLIIPQPEVSYQDRVALDHPIDLLEPLLFVLGRSLNELCARAQSHGMAFNEVRVVLELEDRTDHVRTLRIPIPMYRSKPLLKLLQMDLEKHPPQSPTIAVLLFLKAVPPRKIQGGLFTPLAPEPDKLELTLARIRGLVGEENLGVPELLNTHRPDAFRLVAFSSLDSSRSKFRPRQAKLKFDLSEHRGKEMLLGFRYFRPPPQARVETDMNRPVRLSAPGARGKITAWAGPWRSAGDWWTNHPWDRDEWDVALGEGAVYRIYREPGERWFVEGCYD